jgi:ATP-dependent DNA helicase RecG
VSQKKVTPSFNSNPLDTPVQFIKGVGPKLATVFKSRDIETLKDLLYFFPRKYEDRSQLSLIKDLTEGGTSSLKLTARQHGFRPLGGRFSKLFEVKAQDKDGQWISLKWFRVFKGFEKKFEPGTEFIATGTLKFFGSGREMVHPEIQFDVEDDLHVGRIIPIYTEIDGIPTKTLRKILDTALQLGKNHLREELPRTALLKHNLPSLPIAIQQAHFPDTNHQPSIDRLIYEEFYKFEFHVLSQRMNLQREAGHALSVDELKKSLASLLPQLPFELTRGQQQSLFEIVKDLSSGHPMNRLLQGDVGAGKTAVALLATLAVMNQKSAAGLHYQTAIMAPTEILAEQHYQNALKIFGPKTPVKLLVGKSTASERRAVQAHLDSGEPCLLIGTHALIEDPVKFSNLGLVIIDEQHRFGVEQRRKLREKSKIQPHTLIMTATPIPRTLALTAYGDLEVSIIRERPPGRSPIKTHLIRAAETAKMNEFVRKQLTDGRQAYFIFPLVEDSEEEGFTHLTSAVSAAETLANETFPEFKVGLLHGKLNGKEKASIMERFRANEVQILVATTVVEVGVDVPNATVMVIEHPERFGLSQLHQLRGRIGRGNHASTCFLKTSRPPHLPTPERLEVMCETEDGFKIAEADLELRGPGEFLGTRQSGTLPFKIASLVRDQEWLNKAREDVLELLKSDPELKLPENAPFKTYLSNSGRNESAHLKTS